MNNKGMLKENSLNGKTIIVTGGGSGLGKSMSEYLLTLGANIVITSRREDLLKKVADDMMKEFGGKVLPIACDVRDHDMVSKVINDFPPIYVVFSDTESDNIPNFFESVGREYPYQVMPFANYDTDEIDSYMEITFPDYDNPVIILYDGVRQVRLYEGTGRRAFSAHDLSRILVNK